MTKRLVFAAALLVTAASASGAGPEPLLPSAQLSREVAQSPSPDVARRTSVRHTAFPCLVGGALLVAGAAGEQSNGVLLAGGLLVAEGLVLGPAMGYVYGGVPGNGSFGVGLRALLLLGPVAVTYASSDSWGEDDRHRAATALAIGAAAAAISAIHDIRAVRDRVERQNRLLTEPTSVRLGPATGPFSGAPGLAVTVTLGSGGD